DPQLEQALELMPELLGDERAGIRYAINGLISMTPDGHPLLGEMPEARGLWSAAASWIKEGPGCGRAVAELMSGQVPTVDVHVAVGRVVYTSWLDENGGFRADLTVMRLGEDRFRVVTGGATGMSDAKWIRDHLPAGAFLADLTSAWTTIGLWGPRARDVLASVTAGDVSHAGFAFGTCREIAAGGVVVLASRISCG